MVCTSTSESRCSWQDEAQPGSFSLADLFSFSEDVLLFLWHSGEHPFHSPELVRTHSDSGGGSLGLLTPKGWFPPGSGICLYPFSPLSRKRAWGRIGCLTSWCKATFHGSTDICIWRRGSSQQLSFLEEMMQIQTQGLVLGKFGKCVPEREGRPEHSSKCLCHWVPL